MTQIGLSFLETLDRPALIGMVHVGALPGTPRATHGVEVLARNAVMESALLVEGGVDAIMLENMHDVPYLNRRVGPEIVAAMTAVCAAVRGAVPVPLGVQILAGANREAIAVASATGCQFVRCEGFVFSHVADEGLMPDADAGPLLRFRRAIDATDIAILADIRKKHAAHAITADVTPGDFARAAVFCGADGIIVTGSATGAPACAAELSHITDAVDQPVFVGSGITPANAADYAAADGFIVGSDLKRDGHWENPVDGARVRRLADAIHGMRRA